MAEERDSKLSRRYRELESLEPPPQLDQAILAAAHRAAETSRAPLVAPAGRHRWYYGLAAAAVLVFAVALTLHMERERPDPEATPGPPLKLERELRGAIKPASKPEAAKPEAKPEPKVEAPVFAPDLQPSQPTSAAAEAEQRAAPVPAPERARSDRLAARRERSAERAAKSSAGDRAAVDRVAAERAKVQSQATRASNATQRNAVSAAAAPERPDPWLERIAELRSRGRHAEADKELAEFRRAYPNYPLSDVMRERVEGR